VRIRAVTPQPQDSKLPPPAPPQAINRVLGGPGRGFPNTDDYYPSVARRMGERGVVAVSVCVDAKGRLTADPTLAQSSGSASLDEGGLKLAKAGSGHYRPTTEDGVPVSSCYVYRIRYDLKD
jgi:TonB family protein